MTHPDMRLPIDEVRGEFDRPKQSGYYRDIRLQGHAHATG